MKLNLIITLGFLIYNLVNLKNEEVVLSNTTSSFVQKDSLKINYKKAKTFFKEEQYTNALEIAQEILEKPNLSLEEKVSVNYLIANIFYATRSNKNALKYYRKTLNYITTVNLDNIQNQIDLSFNKDIIKAETLLKYGNTFYRLNSIENLKIYKDSSLYYYNQVEKIPELNNEILEVKSRAYSNSSVIFLNDSLYDKAESYAIKAINIHKKQNNKVNESGALVNLANIYLSESNYNEAKKTYYKALDLIKNIKSSKALMVREKIYFNLAYNLYILKDYKAYVFQELSYNIKDSLRDKEVRNMIEELDAKYDFKSAKKLLLQQEENKRLKAQRTFWIVGIGGVIIILSLLYGVNFYKLKQKNLGLELSQTQLIQSQKIEKIRSDSQVRILNATIDGKESERKQIAETLHDSVSALLSSANLHLQATKGQFNGKTPVEIDKTREIITEASQKIRDLSHTLVSSVLLKFGLKFALKDMADKYSNSQIEINTNFGKVKRYHQSFEIKMYNIIQEFINNILKHSKASLANIDLEEKNGELFLTITDNGIGFDKNQITQKDGLGINQIDARIKVMKGKFHIESSKNNGTKIKVQLPVIEKEQPNLV